MNASDVEHWSNQLDSLVERTDQVRFSSIQGEFSCGQDLCANLVLQTMDTNVIGEMGRLWF